MAGSTHCRSALLCLLLSCVFAPASLAHAQAQLAGTYRAGTSETKVDISTWGEDCGPRPQSATETGHPQVSVKVQGKQLAVVFPDRTLKSDGCWSPNPAVRVASATATATRWRAECQTPSNDAKRERGVYTITAREDGVLELLEESSYDWQLNQSRCVAKVRFSQRVTRGAASAAETAIEAKQAEPPPKTGCTPGPLTRLRLRPSVLSMGPGERTCFTVRGLDAAGCAVANVGTLRWELNKPAGATATLVGGCFKAAAGAAEAEGKFRVVVASGALRDEATVTVATTDLSDITASRGGGLGGEELADGDESDEGASSFGIEAAVKRSSLGVKLALSALLLAMIAGLSWFVVVSGRKRRSSGASEPEDEATRERPRRVRSDAAGSLPGAEVSGAGEQLICPLCRHGYPGGTTRCPRDDAVPIPYAEFVRNAHEASGGPRTCTACGAQLAAGTVFCGACGAKVRS